MNDQQHDENPILPGLLPEMATSFRFDRGRLWPQPLPGLDDVNLSDRAATLKLGLSKECSLAGEDVEVWTVGPEREDNPPRWLIVAGDSSRYALIEVTGWVNYFDAMRYFEPYVRLRKSAD